MTGFNKSDANMVRTAWELSAAMLSFVVAIALGWWFGRVLDAWLGTAPWLNWLFTGLGFVRGDAANMTPLFARPGAAGAVTPEGTASSSSITS